MKKYTAAQLQRLNELKPKLYVQNEYGVEHQDPEAKLDPEDVKFLGETFNINTDTHRTCINCQARQIIKYQDELKPGEKAFKVPCKFIEHRLPSGSRAILNNIMKTEGVDRDRAMLVLRSMQDPVAWAELMFGFDDATAGDPDKEWYLRTYQKEQLRCSSPRKVMRMGRRAGKLLPLDTPIPTPNGFTTMGEVQKGDEVFGPDGKPCRVLSVSPVQTDRKPYRITFDDKTEMIADADHQWVVTSRYTRRREKRTGESPYVTMTTKEMLERGLTIGEVKREFNFRIELTKPVQFHPSGEELVVPPYVLGYWLGDGATQGGLFTIGKEDAEESVSRLESYGYELHKVPSSRLGWRAKGLTAQLREIGVKGRKHIPERYLMASVEERYELLRGLMDSDGTADKRGIASFCTTLPELADDFEKLVGSLGIKATRTKAASFLNGAKHKDRYRFYMNTDEPVFALGRKRGRLEATKGFRLPKPYRAIVSMEQIESVPMRCISVDNPRQMYLCGKHYLPTHNTFTSALRLLWDVFHTQVYKGKKDGKDEYRGPSIMIVTPYQAQVSNIFTEMDELLQRAPDLASQVIPSTSGMLYTKTPFLKMRFKNGATVAGFVSGVGSKQDGSGGGVMRGYSADIIYMDEMDMIPEEIMSNVILPILATRRNTAVLGTSTPIGKHGAFRKWALEDPTFKEDHLPTTVLPQWDEVKDLLLGNTTKEGMEAEYMALFIEGSLGVFKPSLVYAARADYDYSQTMNLAFLKETLGIQRPERMSIVIGIDWNKNAGTEFCVVGYDADQHRWFVLETVNIEGSDFSSIRWKEEVVRLNYKWKPDHIYADEGYGHTIIEDLRLMAHRLRQKPKKNLQQVETAKLVDRLKAFNFSQRVVLNSPIDGTEIIKKGKDFLVENAVRVFEDQRIFFSVDDEVLFRELLAYSVLRRSPTTNKAIYGSNAASVGDHRLDALMLALGGLYLENSEYSPGAMPLSRPEFLSKETLDHEGVSDEFSKTVDHLSRQTYAAPINLIFQKIERQGGAGSPKDQRGSAKPSTIDRRRGSNMEADGPYEHFKKKLPRQGGYSTDHEHLYQQELEAPAVVGTRRRGRNRKKIRRR